jgi:hypothetical protein
LTTLFTFSIRLLRLLFLLVSDVLSRREIFLAMATSRLSPMMVSDPDGKPSFFRNASNKASTYHARVPYLRRLPFSAIAIITTLIFVNLLVWAAVGIVLVRDHVESTRKQ